MVAWTVLASQPTPPGGSEQWASLSIPGTPLDIAYGFRVVIPDITPQSWNTLGYFGVFGVIGDRYIAFPHRPIVAIGRGDPQALQVVVASDSEFPAAPVSMIGISYFIHKWVDSSEAQLWVLRA